MQKREYRSSISAWIVFYIGRRNGFILVFTRLSFPIMYSVSTWANIWIVSGLGKGTAISSLGVVLKSHDIVREVVLIGNNFVPIILNQRHVFTYSMCNLNTFTDSTRELQNHTLQHFPPYRTRITLKVIQPPNFGLRVTAMTLNAHKPFYLSRLNNICDEKYSERK